MSTYSRQPNLSDFPINFVSSLATMSFHVGLNHDTDTGKLQLWQEHESTFFGFTRVSLSPWTGVGDSTGWMRKECEEREIDGRLIDC